MVGDEELDIAFLDVKGSDYDKENSDLNEALYRGGKQFAALKVKLMDPRYADQNVAYFNQRKAAARYTNRIAGIFDFFIRTAFQAVPKIVFSLADLETEKMIQEIEEKSNTLDINEREAYKQSKMAVVNEMIDAREKLAIEKLAYYNQLNVDLQNILSGRMLDMILFGYGTIAVAYPEVPVQEFVNFPAQLASGALDAKLCYICPQDILDCVYFEDGTIDFVKTCVVRDARSVPFGPIDLDEYTWTYFTNTQKVVYSATKAKGKEWAKDQKAKRVSLATYGLGIPIFKCSLDNCLMDRVQEQVLGLFNREIGYDFILNSSCYPQPWAATDKKPNEIAGAANEFTLWLLEKGGTCDYLMPSSDALKALNENIERKYSELLTSINAEATNLSNRDQHAAGPGAKMVDRAPIEAMLCFYAGRLKEALSNVINYIISSRRDDGIVLYKIIGLDNFNPLSSQQRLDNVGKFLALPASATAKQLVMKDLSQSMVPGATAQEREKIDSETVKIDYSITQSFAVGAPAAPTGTAPVVDPEESDPKDNVEE